VIKINEHSEKKWISEHWDKYEIEVWHKGLSKYQIIKGKDRETVEKKAAAKMAEWNALWAKRVDTQKQSQEKEDKKILAEERTTEAQKILEDLDRLLEQAFKTRYSILWESTKEKMDYHKPEPTPPNMPSLRIVKPVLPEIVPAPIRSHPKYKKTDKKLPPKPMIPSEPQRVDAKYKAKLGILDKVISSRRVQKENQAEEFFARDHERWLSQKEAMISTHKIKTENIQSENIEKRGALFQKDYTEWEKNKNNKLKQHDNKVIEYEKECIEHGQKVEEWKANHKKRVEQWEFERNNFLKQQERQNLHIDEKKMQYEEGDSEAVLYYCNLILSKSTYPPFFPYTYELDYNPVNKLLLVEYQLPSVENIPTLEEVRYIDSRNEFTEKHISKTRLNNLYDNMLYQISLRTIQELFSINLANVLSSIVFNGFVSSIDPSTGKEVTACVLSLQADRKEFMDINLSNVDPKACFRKLKGIGSPQLHSLTPIPPIMTIQRDDKRFVSSYEVANKLDEGVNLAAMDWEDFEHLVRELFEQEFSKDGGEVKVTRASRDGGVDAVAFDPDPLKGGKIVIQAKRYTNLVSVSAVRDLYGTVLNEGANKGILVTTSNYGPDAYKFAKGKPLALLDGNNLLHLLQKHGHKAKIDLQEAKLLLAEMEAATEKQ